MSPRPYHALLAPGIALIVASCATVAVNPATEEAAIRARSAEMNRAVTARNVDAIVAFHSPSAVVMMPNASAMTGADAIRQGWRGMLAMPNLSLNWQPTRVTVAGSGDVATEVGSYTMSFDTPQGRINDAGNYTTVWHNIAGSWVIASDMVTSSQPLPPPPPPPPPPAPPAPAIIADMSEMDVHTASGIKWGDLVVPGFAAGAKIAVIHGDPSSNGDYTLRLQFPAGYKFPPHWHPMGEHITVLSGVFQLGMGGTTAPGAIREYQAGDFLYVPGRMPHFGGARGRTVVQLHGTGPFAINLGSP
ncbi:MAG: DUF4440 domain-containing protein [Gemmatimonadaceae bacterium]